MQVAEAHRLDGRSHRVFGTLSYAAATWDRPRRVIVKAEHLRGAGEGKSNPRYAVTNLAGDARAIYEDVYCQRGDSENRIEEQQLGLFADRTSCHAFLANSFRVLLAAAYGLVEHIRRTALVGTELEKAEVGTIRLRLVRVAGLVPARKAKERDDEAVLAWLRGQWPGILKKRPPTPPTSS